MQSLKDSYPPVVIRSVEESCVRAKQYQEAMEASTEAYAQTYSEKLATELDSIEELRFSKNAKKAFEKLKRVTKYHEA